MTNHIQTRLIKNIVNLNTKLCSDGVNQNADVYQPIHTHTHTHTKMQTHTHKHTHKQADTHTHTQYTQNKNGKFDRYFRFGLVY